MLFSVCITYLEETFKDSKISNKWNITGNDQHYKITQCFASFPKHEHYCLKVLEQDAQISLETALRKKIKGDPLFVHFTLRSELPLYESQVNLSLLSQGKAVHSLTFKYAQEDAYYGYSFNKGVMSSGEITHELSLTRSVTFILNKNLKYSLYIDGLILGAGNLTEPFEQIDTVRIDLENGNTTTEIGNIYINSKPQQRYPTLISTLLQYRPTERAAVFKKIVDEEEKRIFGDSLEEDELNPKDEYGVFPSADQVDPRKFRFPYVLAEKQRFVTVEEARSDPSNYQSEFEKLKIHDDEAETNERGEMHDL